MTFLTITALCLLSFSLGFNLCYFIARSLVIKPYQKLARESIDGWKECLELLQALAEDTGRIPKKDGSLVSPFTVKPNDN